MTSELQARRRVMKAGFTPRGIRARIRLVAADRGLSRDDIRRALKASRGRELKRAKRTNDLIVFADAHDVSLDWLVYGDIRRLLP
jgi:hypothetical protein